MQSFLADRMLIYRWICLYFPLLGWVNMVSTLMRHLTYLLALFLFLSADTGRAQNVWKKLTQPAGASKFDYKSDSVVYAMSDAGV